MKSSSSVAFEAATEGVVGSSINNACLRNCSKNVNRIVDDLVYLMWLSLFPSYARVFRSSACVEN